MVQSAFKNIEYWLRYQWFCDGKSIIYMKVYISTINISINISLILTGVGLLDSSY